MDKSMVASLFVLLLAFPTVFGTDHTVGDDKGWDQGVDYTTWPSGKTFKVGDNLVFKYGSTHQVDVVNENDYKSCRSSNTIKNYQDGNSKVPLTTAGKMYFICPTPGHCSSGGMKLEINVVAASTTPSGTPPTTTPSGSTPPTTPSDTPSNPSPSSPSGSTTTSPPPPKGNGAISVSSGMISVLVGSFFVSAILLGFMG